MTAVAGRQPRPAAALMNGVLTRLSRRYEINRFKENNGSDPYRILVSCIISLRTKDEVTYPATERLFRKAATPERIARMRPSTIAGLIYPAGFYRRKAEQIREISRILIAEHQGQVPSTLGELLELPGVGRKTANLVITLGFDLPGICVDVHVHRIANRLGWVRTEHPDQTEMALRAVLAPRWWIPINETLVRHGQQVCKPTSPICSRCPVRTNCRQVDVVRNR